MYFWFQSVWNNAVPNNLRDGVKIHVYTIAVIPGVDNCIHNAFCRALGSSYWETIARVQKWVLNITIQRVQVQLIFTSVHPFIHPSIHPMSNDFALDNHVGGLLAETQVSPRLASPQKTADPNPSDFKRSPDEFPKDSHKLSHSILYMCLFSDTAWLLDLVYVLYTHLKIVTTYLKSVYTVYIYISIAVSPA